MLKFISNSLTVARMYFTNNFLIITDWESVLKIPGDNICLTIFFLIFQKFLQDYQCLRKHFTMTWRHRCNSIWRTTRLMQLKCMEHWMLSWCGKQELYVFNYKKDRITRSFWKTVCHFLTKRSIFFLYELIILFFVFS